MDTLEGLFIKSDKNNLDCESISGGKKLVLINNRKD